MEKQLEKYMGTKNDEVYIWWNKEASWKEEWKILKASTDDLIDMSFTSAKEARKYIHKKGLVETKKYEYA